MNPHVFLKYLVASVLSMAAVRLANMADAALVGNIVGAEGLAGIYRLYNDFQITVKKIKYDVVEIALLANKKLFTI